LEALEKDMERIMRYFKGGKEVSALFVFGSAGRGTVIGESDIEEAFLLRVAERRELERESGILQ
jgi:predicted nucleotidyltransferase